jgi:hypothetical protein
MLQMELIPSLVVQSVFKGQGLRTRPMVSAGHFYPMTAGSKGEDLRSHR